MNVVVKTIKNLPYISSVRRSN